MPGRTVAGYRAKLFRAVHAEAAKRKIDHDGLHDIVKARFGNRSMGDCTDRQLLLLYKDWTGKGLKREAKLPRRGERVTGGLTFVSNLELAELDGIYAQLDWSAEQRQAFVRRQLRGRESIRTRGDWTAVLFGARAILRRGGGDGIRERDSAAGDGRLAVHGGGSAAGAECGAGDRGGADRTRAGAAGGPGSAAGSADGGEKPGAGGDFRAAENGI
jgi:hypothetical protein